MPTAPDPTGMLFEAIADGLSINQLESVSDPTRNLQQYERMKRLEVVVQAHRRVLEQSPSSIDLELDLDLDRLIGVKSPLPITLPPEGHPQRWGHLEKLQRVGGGGFGQVYRARDPMLDRDVALKLLFPRSAPPEEAKRRFLAEARRLARVRHDHVVVVHGAGIHDGRMGLWTEFLEGSTLEHLIVKNGPLSPREAALCGVDLCRALAAVHGAGLIHRDVKTGNVMRESGGRIVLLDFGLVAADPTLDAEGALESTGGTPLYMAPEVLRRNPASVASDIYSLGILLYRLVSGKYPIQATRLSDIQRALDEDRRTPLRTAVPDAPTEFVRIVEKAISLDPAQRYSSAGAMELDLFGFVNPAPPRRPLWRRPRALVGASAAALGLIVVMWWGARQLSPPFEIQASLFRDRDGRPEQIFTGTEVWPGDQIHLRIQSNRTARAWVVNRDPSGAVSRVFPLEGPDPGRPLESGTEYRLPTDPQGDQYEWTITNRAGMESFLLITVAGEFPRLEDALEALPGVSSDPTSGLDALALLVQDSPDSTGKAILTRRKQGTQADAGALAELERIAGEEPPRGAGVRIQRFDLRVAGMKE